MKWRKATLEVLQKRRREMLVMLRKLNVKFRWITCDRCPSRFTCPYAYDLYNTDGDCLAEK